MHLINTLLLGVSAASMATAATTPQYLTLGSLNSNTPSGITTPAYSIISFPITDSKTKASTSCTIKWDWTKKPSSSYTPCTDKSFSVKVSNYNSITDFTLNLQHQYDTKSGKKCVSKSSAAFQTYCGASGACGAVSKKGVRAVVSSSKTGTQK
ncbi:hypothetical protein E4T39_08408 [Aureobasidium subglaciale]|nr:hypothetical protein E4T39_08408 [Aureobasidium subglaciale]